jgi:hypothetical protein
MNENAMMKKEGRGMAKVGMQKMAKGGLTKREVKKADAAGRKVTKELKFDDMKDRTKKMAMGGKAYAKGGSVSARADGCAIKGKTKGKEIKMAKGGKTC